MVFTTVFFFKVIGFVSGGVGIFGIFSGNHTLVLWGAIIAIIFGGFLPAASRDPISHYFMVSPLFNLVCGAIGMLFSHFVLKIGWGNAFLYSSCWILTILSFLGGIGTVLVIDE